MNGFNFFLDNFRIKAYLKKKTLFFKIELFQGNLFNFTRVSLHIEKMTAIAGYFISGICLHVEMDMQ